MAKKVSAKVIYDYLTEEKGLSHNHAMGMISNIQAESSFGPAAVNPSSGASGLFQYNFPERKEKFIMEVPNWESDWKSQIDFALKEDETVPYLKADFNSPEQASMWFTMNWERPEEAEIKARERASTIKELSKNIGVDYTDPITQSAEDAYGFEKGITIEDLAPGEADKYIELAAQLGEQYGKDIDPIQAYVYQDLLNEDMRNREGLFDVETANTFVDPDTGLPIGNDGYDFSALDDPFANPPSYMERREMNLQNAPAQTTTPVESTLAEDYIARIIDPDDLQAYERYLTNTGNNTATKPSTSAQSTPEEIAAAKAIMETRGERTPTPTSIPIDFNAEFADAEPQEVKEKPNLKDLDYQNLLSTLGTYASRQIPLSRALRESEDYDVVKYPRFTPEELDDTMAKREVRDAYTTAMNTAGDKGRLDLGALALLATQQAKETARVEQDYANLNADARNKAQILNNQIMTQELIDTAQNKGAAQTMRYQILNDMGKAGEMALREANMRRNDELVKSMFEDVFKA